MSQKPKVIDMNINLSASREEIDEAKDILKRAQHMWVELACDPSAMLTAMCEILQETAQGKPVSVFEVN